MPRRRPRRRDASTILSRSRCTGCRHWRATRRSRLWFAEGLRRVLSTFARSSTATGRWGARRSQRNVAVPSRAIRPLADGTARCCASSQDDGAARQRARATYYHSSLGAIVHVPDVRQTAAPSATQAVRRFLARADELGGTDLDAAVQVPPSASRTTSSRTICAAISKRGRYGYAEIELRDRGGEMTVAVQPRKPTSSLALGRLATVLRGRPRSRARRTPTRVIALVPALPGRLRAQSLRRP